MVAQENQGLYQKFKSTTERPLRKLEVIKDKSGNLVIYWDDVERNFKNVDCLLNDDVAVSFVRDEVGELLMPHRIKYYPNSVLTVVEKEGTSPPSSWSSVSSSRPQSIVSLNSAREMEDIVNDLTVATVTSTPTSSGKSKPKRSPGSGLVRAPSFAIIHSSQQAFFAHQAEVDVYNQQLSVARAEDRQAIIDKIEESGKKLEAKIEENIKLTEQVAQSAAELNEAQQQILKMQEMHARMMTEVLERTQKLDKRVKALATMTLELFEFQVPRLFIVLPDKLDSWGDIWNPLTERFRLYFLCECGEHTKDPTNSNRPNHIHMALHEGYPVTRPNEFFKQYGPYLLTVMEMVRYGTAIAGSVVPALGQLGITYGIEQMQQAVDISKNKFTPLLDKSIAFTQSKLGSSFGSSGGENSFETREALQGADLRHLASFLESADTSKALANLYRTVTPDGHVKWVCSEHFNINHDTRASEKLVEVVEKYNGKADKSKASIEVSLPDSGAASELYGALEHAQYFNVLFVNFEWEVSKADLESLYQTIMLSGITDLRVAGQGLRKAPIFDSINYKNRFDPLISLVTAPKLRSFALDDCPSFLKRVSSFRSTNNSVKSMSLTDTWSSQKTKASPDAIAKLVNSCPDLIELQLHRVQDEDAKRAYDALESTLRKHKSIKRVVLDGSVYEVVDQCVSLVEAVFPADINKPLWNQQKLRRLTVESFSTEDLGELKKIMVNNPCLVDIAVRTTPEDLFKHTTRFQNLVQGLIWPVTVTFGSEGFIGATIVYSSAPPPVNEKSGPMPSGNGFSGTMDVQYWNFSGCGTTALQPRVDSDFEMLDWATRKLPEPFTTLALCVSELSPVGLASLGRVLGQTDLELLSITTTQISRNIDRSEELATANALVSLDWSRLKRLELRGHFVHLWITEVSKVLEAWKRRGPSNSPATEVQWESLLIRADGELTEVSYLRSLQLMSIFKTLPPKEIDLCNLRLHVQDWCTVLKSLKYDVLERLRLESNVGYELTTVKEIVPGHVSCVASLRK
ncbi:hypothetical protein BGZ59_003625 [Podila verticillata]|nr:hypothetical protein BGZ59_003625 [Podila verticillata]KFH68930.1 hypothetical protein MVEG_05733 [Podila verticillata NRRL 6337]